MKPATRIRIALTVLAVLTLAACTPMGQAPVPSLQPTAEIQPVVPTAPPEQPATEAPAEMPAQPGGMLQLPAPEVCNGMAQALSEALSRATGQSTPLETVQSEVPMTDYARGAGGTGCRVQAEGTGQQFTGPDTVMREIVAVLTGGGWQEDMMLAAGGPTAIGSGFRSGDLVAIAYAGWQPDAATSCPSDRPISECEVPPEHQAYIITLDTAQTIGYGGAMMPNPASQNCEAQGGSLTIEQRGDGGQYGVCDLGDNQQCEEWALMRGECPVGGVKVTGYTTPAGRYCAITGGTYEVTGKSGEPDEQGVCTLAGGTQCDAWEYYNGTCDASAGAQPPPTEPATAELLLMPPSEEVCNGMAQALAEAASRVATAPTPIEVTQAADPIEMTAPATDGSATASGTGCRATASGTGEQFASPFDVMEAIRAVLGEGGWAEDPRLVADGATGTGAGFRSGDVVSLAVAMWLPDAAANCPTDRPIFECKLTPAQRLYTITLDTARELGARLVGMPNPASQNCEAQGGSLTIGSRPDGGQYGVCYFEDNRQCEEWALMRGECPVGGVKVTGYTTPAATFCAITGGKYAMTGRSGQSDERGTCALPDGRQCEVWSYYLGGCESPLIGMANPAAKNCAALGGKPQTVRRPDGGQYGVCGFEDNRQCEEWALLRGECPAGGVKVTGYITPAATYCAITGGKYTITGRSGQANEHGTCLLPDGVECEVWSYYEGACRPPAAEAPAPAIANPASQQCVAQGGKVAMEQRGDGGQFGVCYFADNLQCEEWALLRGDCPVGGVKVTGYRTPAGRYCAITGGAYSITGNSGLADERGTCKLPGGKTCDAWDYFNGKCDAASGV